MAVDNVIYVTWLSPTPRRFGWSRGPNTPDTGTRNDWPAVGAQGHTFHWIHSNFSDMSDTVVNLSTAGWSHQKNYVSQTTGVWLITDMSRLMATLRTRGFGTFADFLEQSARIPRVGDPD